MCKCKNKFKITGKPMCFFIIIWEWKDHPSSVRRLKTQAGLACLSLKSVVAFGLSVLN